MTSFLCVRKRESILPNQSNICWHRCFLNIFSYFSLFLFSAFNSFYISIFLSVNFQLVHFVSSFCILFFYAGSFFFSVLINFSFGLFFPFFLTFCCQSQKVYRSATITVTFYDYLNGHNKCEWTSVAIQTKYDKLIRSITAMHINKFSFYNKILFWKDSQLSFLTGHHFVQDCVNKLKVMQYEKYF